LAFSGSPKTVDVPKCQQMSNLARNQMVMASLLPQLPFQTNPLQCQPMTGQCPQVCLGSQIKWNLFDGSVFEAPTRQIVPIVHFQIGWTLPAPRDRGPRQRETSAPANLHIHTSIGLSVIRGAKTRSAIRSLPRTV